MIEYKIKTYEERLEEARKAYKTWWDLGYRSIYTNQYYLDEINFWKWMIEKRKAENNEKN